MANYDVATKYGTGRKTLKSYIVGLALSLLFTFTAFAMVGYHLVNNVMIYVGLTVLALSQLLAQVIFFLRLTASREGRWTTMPFIFTLIIVFIILGGTIWIMLNLKYNMVT